MNTTVATYSEAIDRALAHALATDPRVVVFGEDVQLMRRGLVSRFGADRIRNTPISESAFLGAAVGAAMAGQRPVVELLMIDFVAVALDALLNHAAKLATFSGGRWDAPLVVRAPCGAGYGDGGQHGQALWGMLAGIPGLTVVAPATPADAAGLLLAALEDPGPVVFLEHKLLTDDTLDYLAAPDRPGIDLDIPAAGREGPVADPPATVPIGVAVRRRSGDDVTLVSLGVGTHRCLEAADRLAEEGLEATVVDLRTVRPLDRHTVVEAVGATGAVVVVDEDFGPFGLSGEIAAILAEADVVAAYRRVTTAATLPFAPALEAAALPNVGRIVAAAREVCGARSPRETRPDGRPREVAIRDGAVTL